MCFLRIRCYFLAESPVDIEDPTNLSQQELSTFETPAMEETSLYGLFPWSNLRNNSTIVLVQGFVLKVHSTFCRKNLIAFVISYASIFCSSQRVILPSIHSHLCGSYANVLLMSITCLFRWMCSVNWLDNVPQYILMICPRISTLQWLCCSSEC